MVISGRHTSTDAARLFRVSPTTVSRVVSEVRQEESSNGLLASPPRPEAISEH